jgi:hypothetical protein
MANGSFHGELLSVHETKPVSLTHRIVAEINHPGREVIAGSPIRVRLAKFLRSQGFPGGMDIRVLRGLHVNRCDCHVVILVLTLSNSTVPGTFAPLLEVLRRIRSEPVQRGRREKLLLS